MVAHNALVPYYGCKRQAARKIIPYFGNYKSFWDIMAGSCAIPLSLDKCRQIVINDLNGSVINLARVVADDEFGPQLFDRLYRTAFCEQLYHDSIEWLYSHEDPAGYSLDWAYHYFVVSWQGRNGFVGTQNELNTGFCKRYSATGGDPATRFRGAVENIPEWWRKMRHWTILSQDAIKLCEKIEDADRVVVYVDPPYLEKGAEYLFDFTGEEHEALAESLRRFKHTKVVVSYYDHPLLTDLYLKYGWNKVAIDVPKNLSVTTGAKKAPEVLLINR